MPPPFARVATARTCRRLLTPPLIFLSVAAAQTLPGDPRPAVSADAARTPAAPTTLSPFVVNAEADSGYQATAMLQGGRGRIELADLATQVSIFTREFLQDVAATGMEEALLFSTNTRTYYDMVDYDGGDRPGAMQSYDNNNSRGLGALDKTRNLFRTAIEPDAYNTDRLSLINGANAVQFGVGGAAGTADSTSAQASLTRNRQRVEFRTDSYGSERVALDVGQVLVKDRLALRLAGLRDNKEYFTRPGYEANARAFAAVTYKPFAHTVVRLEGEWVRRLDSRGSTAMPRDSGYMSWLEGQRAGTPLVYSNLAATAPTTQRPPAPSFIQNDGVTRRNYTFNTTPLLYVWPDNSAPSFAGFQDVRNTTLYRRSGANNTTNSFLDPAFPWNTNLAGFSRYNLRTTGRQSATVEQKLARTTYLEIGASRETYHHKTAALMSDRTYDLMVDVNRFLPDGVTANPMYGRPFTENGPGALPGGAGNWEEGRLLQYRVTLAHAADFTRSAGWLRHLGHHRIGLFAGADDETKYLFFSTRFMILGRPSFLSEAAKANPLSNDRLFNLRLYLPAVGSTRDPGAFAFPGVSRFGDVMGTLNLTTASGEKFQVSMFEHPVGMVGDMTFNSLQRQSAAASTSSAFLANHLVVNLGTRRDQVRNSSLTNLPPLYPPPANSATAYPDYRHNLPAPVWTPFRRAERINSGLVLRPPVVGDWLAFGYDHSRNASLNEVAVVRDALGTVLEAPYGEAQEFSLRLRLLSGRLHAKVNFFHALQRNIALNNQGLIQGLLDFERQLLVLDPAYAINPLFDRRSGLGAAAFRLPGDNSSRGLDVELVFNPRPNWRLFWNLGRTRTVTDSRLAQPWFDYIESRLPAWRLFRGNWSAASYDGNQTVEEAFVARIDTPRERIEANLGAISSNVQTWRSNLVSTYTVATGRLRGTSLGANFRYRAPSVIGFGERVDPRLGRVPDPSIVYKTDGYIVTGLMGGYRCRGRADTSWRFQLNVNNLFNTRRVVLTRVWTDGKPRNYGRQPGRELVFTVELEH